MIKYLQIYWSLVCWNVPTRATRLEYFLAGLVGMLVSLALLGLDIAIAGTFPAQYPDWGIAVLQTIFSVWMIVPGWKFASSRLRDTGKYTWKSLLWAFVPVVGFFVILWALTRPTGEVQSSSSEGPHLEDWSKFSDGIEIDPRWRLNHSLVLK